MISNQVLQTTIDGLKNITRIDICVMDTEGKALATTINNVEEYEDAVMAFVESPADSQVLQGYQFFKVFDDHQLEYVILAKGDVMMFIWWESSQLFKFKIFLLRIKSVMTRTILLKIFCSTISFS